MNDYRELLECLEAKGIGSYFQREDQLVISDHNPGTPASNCFWVTKKDDDWYIGTWLPAIYCVAKDQDICSVCEGVFRSSSKAIYTIDDSVVEQFGLRRLSETETDELRFAG